MSDRAEVARMSGLHLHNKNGTFSKSGRTSEDMDEIMDDPMRVYRKTIMAMGRENFFLKQQFGNANNQVMHLSRQLAIATEENQKLRSIVGKIGLGRSFGPDGMGRMPRGIDDSFLAARMADEERMLRQQPPLPPRPDMPPQGHGGMQGRFDMPAHQQGFMGPMHPGHLRRSKGDDVASRHHHHLRHPMPMPPWQSGPGPSKDHDPWEWRQQHTPSVHHSMASRPPRHSEPSAAPPTTSSSSEAASARPHPQPRCAEGEGEPRGGDNGGAAGGAGSSNGAKKDAGAEKPSKDDGGATNGEVTVEEKRAVSPQGEASEAEGGEGKEEESCASTPKGGDKDKSGKFKGTSAGKEGQAQPRFWTKEEHARFLEAVRLYGYGNAREIAAYVQTRSITQVRTHAQKYILKLSKIGSQQSKDDKDLAALDGGGGARGGGGDDQSLSFLGDKDPPSSAFLYPRANAMARMHMDPYPFHSPGVGAFAPPRPGDEDPAVAATWLESMELSGSFLDRGPSR